MTERINVSISKELKKKIEEKIKQTNFKSISEYITFVLEQITSEAKNDKQAYTKEEEIDIEGASLFTEEEENDARNNQGYTQGEEEELKKQLEDQGYI